MLIKIMEKVLHINKDQKITNTERYKKKSYCPVSSLFG